MKNLHKMSYLLKMKNLKMIKQRDKLAAAYMRAKRNSLG
jgi:hypothetical protein